MNPTQLLSETLDRAQEHFEETLNQMSVTEANTMPVPLIKSVTWLMWHTARELEMQTADLQGRESLWVSDGWNSKFALELPDDTEDWRHTPAEAAKVIVSDPQLLKDYLAAAIQFTKDYLAVVSEESLTEIIDRSWTPPVTRQARIVSIVDDAIMHSGQAVYTRRLVIGK